ncbi:hypothetical protein tf_29 [Pseudomonas phage tf]|uniref:Uncharacterized protein n=1 Tax=Pseudomonas phage tf TaxID=1114179 RepID=I2FLQ2_9CAUD|nr:hypothetical protein tf_29 [Pseudomonas phage tf]CCE60786.1 hypothetical protein tf_29 [Pseudomonas phage tf]
MEIKGWLKRVTTSVKGSWLSDGVKPVWVASQEMLNVTGRDVKFRKSSDESWVPTRWSTMLSALKMAVLTPLAILGCVVLSLTLLMGVGLVIVRPRVAARSNQWG